MIAANTPQTGNGENAVNRENVIRGLGVCSPIGCAKEKCPYYEGPESEFWGNPDGYECEFNLRQDAIKLLKEQEPRVMTPTEAYTADFVYVEFDGVITPALRTSNEREGHRESYFTTQQLGGEWMRWDDYGITWRCWTSRPSDEVRRATPWEMK